MVASTIAREADYVFYTLAESEIAVATTRAYSTWLIASYVLAMEFARVRVLLDEIEYVQMLTEKIECLLEDKERISWLASKQSQGHLFHWPWR